MTSRNMGFSFYGNIFKEKVSSSIEFDEWVETGKIYGTGPCVGVASVECCGWLEISNLYSSIKTHQEEIYKILQVLMHEECIYSDALEPNYDEDDEYENQPVKFPLFCVTTDDEVAKWLKENGWEPLKPFVNPNTGNTCMPFYWHS